MQNDQQCLTVRDYYSLFASKKSYVTGEAGVWEKMLCTWEGMQVIGKLRGAMRTAKPDKDR